MDVVLGDRAPMHVARSTDLAPASDAAKKTFDARPVAADAVAVQLVSVDDQAAIRVAHPEFVAMSAIVWTAGDPCSTRSRRYSGTRSSTREDKDGAWARGYGAKRRMRARLGND